MGFRRRGARDEDSDENKEAEKEEIVVEAIPITFFNVLEEGMPILHWLSFYGSAPLFRASKATRIFLSMTLRAQMTFDVAYIGAENAVDTPRMAAERRRVVQRTRIRLPQSSAGGVLGVHLKVPLMDCPLRRAAINRLLGRSLPMVKWEEIPELRLRLRGQLELLDRVLYNSIGTLYDTDALPMLEDPEYFRNVTRVSLSVPEIISLKEGFCMPQVHRLKLHCQDIAFEGTALEHIGQIFPNLTRLHLYLIPIGLLPLCGPGFSAPKDLRLTLPPDRSHIERECNVFVASHLISLPFSWDDVLFRNVVRLQMSELNEDHEGLSMQQMGSTIRALPHLRRLGTVSSRMARLLDITGEDFKLEELVVVTENDEIGSFFKMFLAFEQTKKRCSLRRLCVHMLASDGVSRLKLHLENAVCAGWHNIANNMLHSDGILVFSFGAKQLLETAVAQLAWFDPLHFNVDGVEYKDGRHPVSTPEERALPYWSTDAMPRPNGTLVSGPLRPSTEKEEEEHLLGSSPRTDPPMSPTTPSTPHNKAHKKKKNAFSWIGMSLVDVCDHLVIPHPA